MNTAYGLDMVDFVFLMFQTGYYTLRQDKDRDLYLDYPNDEMRRMSGRTPVYTLIDDSELRLVIWAASAFAWLDRVIP